MIECLKYALTGECPPGSDRGKNFVHDPKIFGLADVLGQIKLEVRNVQGNRLSICRSMKLGMKRNKISFETLDATLNYMNDDDKKGSESISKRCADVDLVMSQFMGVSKAIINNVLFCHQEDSSWPLDEPKKLKEKFDAIFGITEYNRALDRIIKMRKDEMEQLKVKGNSVYCPILRFSYNDFAGFAFRIRLAICRALEARNGGKICELTKIPTESSKY